jgi:hypothetical protein
MLKTHHMPVLLEVRYVGGSSVWFLVDFLSVRALWEKTEKERTVGTKEKKKVRSKE